ncbi:MAG: serine kinase/phosphatase [Pseudomonas sp.]|uniref:serine kinase/phosphatase n=1 Tax=Pseudomonas sp. TaxID=306 RepID=UPI003396F164
MTTRRAPHAPQPAPIDDLEDQMGSMRELSFPDDPPRGRIGDPPADQERAIIDEDFHDERVREAGLTAASVADHQPTADDLAPETLIRDDGARSPDEPGQGRPADQDLNIVGLDEIGAGDGLDEAEEAELASDEPVNSGRDRQPGPVEK